MKYQSRELLVTTKVAQSWHDEFDQKVDELMSLVSRVDNETYVSRSTEILDVYHDRALKKKRKGGKNGAVAWSDRPFEFLTFRN